VPNTAQERQWSKNRARRPNTSSASKSRTRFRMRGGGMTHYSMMCIEHFSEELLEAQRGLILVSVS
jgi:hypothetical protein